MRITQAELEIDKLLVREFYERQESRKEQFNRLVCFLRDNLDKQFVLEQLGKKEEEVAEPFAEYAKKIISGKIERPEILPEDYLEIVRETFKLEAMYRAAIKRRVQNLPLYTRYHKYVKGVGELLSFGIYAFFAPIDRFPHVSNFYSYGGLGLELRCKKCGKRCFEDEAKRQEFIEKVKKRKIKKKKPEDFICKCKEPEPEWVPQKKRAGDVCLFNPWLKGFLRYRLGVLGLLMSRGWYFQKCREFKERELAKGYSKGHAQNRAERKMVKLFLCHTYIAWRHLEGLQVEPHYGAAHGFHEFIPPIVDNLPDRKGEPVVWCREVEYYCDSCGCRKVCPKRIV